MMRFSGTRGFTSHSYARIAASWLDRVFSIARFCLLMASRQGGPKEDKEHHCGASGSLGRQQNKSKGGDENISGMAAWGCKEKVLARSLSEWGEVGQKGRVWWHWRRSRWGSAFIPKALGVFSDTKHLLIICWMSNCPGDEGSGGRNVFNNFNLAIGSDVDVKRVSSGSNKSA